MIPVIHIIRGNFLLSFVQHVCGKISFHIIPVGIMIIFLPFFLETEAPVLPHETLPGQPVFLSDAPPSWPRCLPTEPQACEDGGCVLFAVLSQRLAQSSVQ